MVSNLGLGFRAGLSGLFGAFWGRFALGSWAARVWDPCMRVWQF